LDACRLSSLSRTLCALAFLFAGLASAGLFFVRARTDYMIAGAWFFAVKPIRNFDALVQF
jgi:hypothetical protein